MLNISVTCLSDNNINVAMRNNIVTVCYFLIKSYLNILWQISRSVKEPCNVRILKILSELYNVCKKISELYVATEYFTRN